jgi:hypothetical protein
MDCSARSHKEIVPYLITELRCSLGLHKGTAHYDESYHVEWEEGDESAEKKVRDNRASRWSPG